METKLKPASELTDLEAEKELTELLGGCWHHRKENEFMAWCDKCSKLWPCDAYDLFEQKPYATSYDAIIPVIVCFDPIKRTLFLNIIGHPYFLTIHRTPRQLLNAVIEALRNKKS